MIDITTHTGNIKIKNTHENKNYEEFNKHEVMEITDDNVVLSYNDPGTDYRHGDMEDLDPSLLCPEIIMELGETPIVINNDNQVQYTKIHCTVCNDHLGSALSETSNICVHPLLNVLICKGCYDFYATGEFEKDDDGSETYCRWCGQGGQVVCCSNCEFVFCMKCIRINLGRKKLADIKDSDDWTCFKCDTSQLTNLKVHCAEFMEYIQRERLRASTLENAALFLKTDYSQCCSSNKTCANGVKKKKRKSSDDGDDDYYPHAKQVLHRSSMSSTKTSVPACNAIMPVFPQKPLITVAKKTISNSTTTSNVTKAIFKPRPTFTSYIKPTGQMVKSISTSSDIRTSCGIPNYIKILPKVPGLPILPPASKSTQNVISSSVTTNQTCIQKVAHLNDKFKHQEDEISTKTIQAGARINSDASWSLIRLRRQKATATNLEDIVVLYNKLQGVLNTMINSFTQLEKSLTEARQATNNKTVNPQRNPPLPQTSRYRCFNNNHVSASNTGKNDTSTQAKSSENISYGYVSNSDSTKTATIVNEKYNTQGDSKHRYVPANLRNGVNKDRKYNVTLQPKMEQKL